MPPSDMVFAIAGVVGAVGGCFVAYEALTAKHRRDPAENALRPLLERFCGAIIDGAVITSPFCRLSLYDSFFVLRAAFISVKVDYVQVRSMRIGTLGAPVVFITADNAGRTRHVTLYAGADNLRVMELIKERSVPPPS